jgi:hypothetical protein
VANKKALEGLNETTGAQDQVICLINDVPQPNPPHHIRHGAQAATHGYIH